jgi:hypothetical protein
VDEVPIVNDGEPSKPIIRGTTIVAEAWRVLAVAEADTLRLWNSLALKAAAT